MRSSNYDKILEAAIRVIQRAGITALTFDSVAAESGITRGGIIYHFKSRDDLIDAIHRHVAGQWEANLHEELGAVSVEAASPDERLAAYVRTCAQSATSADLQLILSPLSGDSASAWQKLYETWAAPADLDDDHDLARFIARLAADGLWMHEAVAAVPLTEQQKQRVIAAINRSFLPAAETDA